MGKMISNTALRLALALLIAIASSSCLSESEAPAETQLSETVGDEQLGTLGAAACYNPDGVNYALAGLAAATAQELGRWQTATDFKLSYRCGYVGRWGCNLIVELSATGKAQCADGVCANVQAILDFQKKEANGEVVFPGGAVLRNDVFNSRLYANYQRQLTCNARHDHGKDSNCPAEAHKLRFLESTDGVCEKDYWFHASNPVDGSSLKRPGQLKNQLITFGSTSNNPYLAFDWQGDDVKVDPGPGTISTERMSSGSCRIVRSSGMYSITNLNGRCCMYRGRKKTFRRSSFSRNYYLCK